MIVDPEREIFFVIEFYLIIIRVYIKRIWKKLIES